MDIYIYKLIFFPTCTQGFKVICLTEVRYQPGGQ